MSHLDDRLDKLEAKLELYASKVELFLVKSEIKPLQTMVYGTTYIVLLLTVVGFLLLLLRGH